MERNGKFLILVEIRAWNGGRQTPGTGQLFRRGLRNSGEVQGDLSSLNCVGARRQLVSTSEQRQADPCSPCAAHGAEMAGAGQCSAVQALGDVGAQCIRSLGNGTVASAEMPPMSYENSWHTTDKPLFLLLLVRLGYSLFCIVKEQRR